MTRFSKSGEGLLIYEDNRPTQLRIMRARFGIIVLLEAPLEIICATNIKRFVGTLKDVDEMHAIVTFTSALQATAFSDSATPRLVLPGLDSNQGHLR